jgi:amino acid transporter
LLIAYCLLTLAYLIQMKLKRDPRAWRLCKIIAIVLSVLTFTPVIIPYGQFRPLLFGMPYTLWSGLLLTILLVLLTWIGTRVHPSGDEPENLTTP